MVFEKKIHFSFKTGRNKLEYIKNHEDFNGNGFGIFRTP